MRRFNFILFFICVALQFTIGCEETVEIDNVNIEIYTSNPLDTLKTSVNKVVIYDTKIEFYKMYLDDNYNVQKKYLVFNKSDIDSLVISRNDIVKRGSK